MKTIRCKWDPGENHIVGLVELCVTFFKSFLVSLTKCKGIPLWFSFLGSNDNICADHQDIDYVTFIILIISTLSWGSIDMLDWD